VWVLHCCRGDGRLFMGIDLWVSSLLFEVEGMSCVCPSYFLEVDFFVMHNCTAPITYIAVFNCLHLLNKAV